MDTHSVIGIIIKLPFYFLAANTQGTTLLVLLLIVLLLLSFTISGAEVAIFSLNSKDINMLKTKQHSAAKRIISFLKEPKEVFASLMIADIFINISFIILANFLITEFISFGNLHFILEMLIKVIAITFILVFAGKILPKVWATQNNLRFAYGSSVVVESVHLLLRRISKWIVSVADKIGKGVGANKSEAISIQEMDEAIDVKTDEEASLEEKNIMKGIIKFGAISVKQIMRSRLEVNGINHTATFSELIKKVEELHYSRLPVYKGSLDEVLGIINTKDLVTYLDEADSFDWRRLMRTPYFVPESKLIADLMRDFQSKHIHFAVVVDEFGGTSGIVTMEDIIEEVIGEVRDEFDEEENKNKKIDDNTYVFEGKTMIHDICKTMHLPIDMFDEVKGESESLAGLVLELAGAFPKVNDVVSSGDFNFIILEADKNRILLVEISITPRP